MKLVVAVAEVAETFMSDLNRERRLLDGWGFGEATHDGKHPKAFSAAAGSTNFAFIGVGGLLYEG